MAPERYSAPADATKLPRRTLDLTHQRTNDW